MSATNRAFLIDWLRGETIGPARGDLDNAMLARFNEEPDGLIFKDAPQAEGNARSGLLAWVPSTGLPRQEVLYFQRESPFRKYGAGRLHPMGIGVAGAERPAELAAEAGIVGAIDQHDDGTAADGDAPLFKDNGGIPRAAEEDSLDVAIAGADGRDRSTMGISFCVRLAGDASELRILFPREKKFKWQDANTDLKPFPVNGRYDRGTIVVPGDGQDQQPRRDTAWLRYPLGSPDAIVMTRADLDDAMSNGPLLRDIPLPSGTPGHMRLCFQAFVRARYGAAPGDGRFLVTLVLVNRSSPGDASAATLFQSYFEVAVQGGAFEPYPETQRKFSDLDDEEKSLALLYRDSPCWAIGHGCAGSWDTPLPNESPSQLAAEVLPAVETPSMTPDIHDAEGNPIALSMREMAEFQNVDTNPAYQALAQLLDKYQAWINQRALAVGELPQDYKPVAEQHLESCRDCLGRMRDGFELIATDESASIAFRLANRAMLLQQIATKQIRHRPLVANGRAHGHGGEHLCPKAIHAEGGELETIGRWRAFQIAFLLLSIRGLVDPGSGDRTMVDLIWFPTGGGKTEAYMGAMAFHLLYQRLVMVHDPPNAPGRDGTNILMRYTLRMLTTQQFQRAASLICALEAIRTEQELNDGNVIGGGRFSLGLWIGATSSPNDIANAKAQANQWRQHGFGGNPLVLTECPWCRSAIGRIKVGGRWRTPGLVANEGRMSCPNSQCRYGNTPAARIPIEVVDERIYNEPPAMVIATADKLAMVTYRPRGARLFGRRILANGEPQFEGDDKPAQEFQPPSLIVQDELHLISGPLGTLFGLYETLFEELCATGEGKPKIICSTATIRGVEDQVRALFDRHDVRLFPSPGLELGDSFFGRYARKADDSLDHGRLYLGFCPNDFGSFFTSEVRAFSSLLFAAQALSVQDENERDPWWTNLVFFNSLRELGGAKTLLDSDTRSRLKYLSNRENVPLGSRRRLRVAEELSSRKSQGELVELMDRLGTPYPPPDGGQWPVDVCLASSIIEVGVDIDRLSLMLVAGQPKTTAQYIQVTGRVGRRWWERPGLVVSMSNPAKSRDLSHFEHFTSYHLRMYERVEPTTATPFAPAALERAAGAVAATYARLHSHGAVDNPWAFQAALDEIKSKLIARCESVQGAGGPETTRSIAAIEKSIQRLADRWQRPPASWGDRPDGNASPLLAWPGKYYSPLDQRFTTPGPTSLRQVDATSVLAVTDLYAMDAAPPD